MAKAFFRPVQAKKTRRKDLMVGDVVKVFENLDLVKARQKGHGEWESNMALLLGKLGKVKEIYSNGDVKVEINDGFYRFNRSNLNKMELSVGDAVLISDNLESVMTALNGPGGGGWSAAVGKALGRIGKVEAFYGDGDVKVMVNNRFLALNPKILTKVTEQDYQRQQRELEHSAKAAGNMVEMPQFRKEEAEKDKRDRCVEKYRRSFEETMLDSRPQFVPKSYDVIEELGRGGFGVVYKCRDKNTFRFFVIKECLMISAQDLVVAENEVAKLKELRHPRVVDYYASKWKDGIIFIFMEYLSGGSVRTIIKTFGPLSESQALNFVEQTLEGLAFVHAKLIIHRDIKCDNLLLDRDGHLKLGDFGIAMEFAVDSSGMSQPVGKEVGGTWYFMAPEVIKGQKFGRSADMWSLGCTMVEMLTGNPPYRYMNPFEYIAARTNDALSFDVGGLVPMASSLLKPFLVRLLKCDRADRYPNAGVAVEDFQRIFLAC